MAFVNFSLSELLYCTSLIETVRNTSPEATIIVSGPLPTYRQGQERFMTPVERRLDACGEMTLPVSCWIGGQRLKHHTPPLTRGRDHLSTRNRFSPLRELERDATVIMGTSMVRHVRATSGKDKVCTHCSPGAHVLDVAAQVPEILNGDERVGAVVLNVGANDIRLRF
ncbi:hypothetical protein F2P79_019155 [Pimephales promelas]|nr:hypothetical protein F2P79_019155 [Pimephales promelas]